MASARLRWRRALLEAIHADCDADGGLVRVPQALLAVHVAVQLYEQLIGLHAYLAINGRNCAHGNAGIVREGLIPSRHLSLRPLIVLKRAQHPEQRPELAKAV